MTEQLTLEGVDLLDTPAGARVPPAAAAELARLRAIPRPRLEPKGPSLFEVLKAWDAKRKRDRRKRK